MGSNAYDVSGLVALSKVIAPDLTPEDLRPRAGGGRHPQEPLPSWEITQEFGAAATVATVATATAATSAPAPYCSVHVLNISENSITSNALAHLARALARNSSLRMLDLSGNSVAAMGLKNLSEMLICNQTLTQLDVSRNGVVASGGDQVRVVAAAHTPKDRQIKHEKKGQSRK